MAIINSGIPLLSIQLGTNASQSAGLFFQGAGLFFQGAELFFQEADLFFLEAELFFLGAELPTQELELCLQATELFFKRQSWFIWTVAERLTIIYAEESKRVKANSLMCLIVVHQ